MTASLTRKTLSTLQQEIIKHSLPSHFITAVQQWLVPIASIINETYLSKKTPIIISFNGAQGSGKSTITHFLSLILKHHFNRQNINISLDDFYFTQQQRIHLSQKIHPLLITRGVPGTHDLKLAINTLNHLKHCSQDNPCYVPVFDKAKDDRKERHDWVKKEAPCDIIIFEGWCNHAPTQTDAQLMTAINDLEKNEDPQGIWRCYVNNQLKDYQRYLFSQCDYLFFIKIPSFAKVLEWRSLQEKKLSQASPKNSTMNTYELLRFIQHYERITRSCLNELPLIADTTIELDAEHQIKSLHHLKNE